MVGFSGITMYRAPHWGRLNKSKRLHFTPDFDQLAPSPTGHPRHANPQSAPRQIAKSLYSGLIGSVGEFNITAPTVALVPCSIRMQAPVSRFFS